MNGWSVSSERFVKDKMGGVKFILYALLFVLFLIFIIQNYTTLTASHSLRLNIGLASLETVPLPFYFIALILFFMGFLLAVLLNLPRNHRIKKELREAQTTTRRLEEQVGRQRKPAPPITPGKESSFPSGHES